MTQVHHALPDHHLSQRPGPSRGLVVPVATLGAAGRADEPRGLCRAGARDKTTSERTVQVCLARATEAE